MNPTEAPERRRRAVQRFIEHPRTDHAVALLIVTSVALLLVELLVEGYTLVHKMGDALTMVFVVELSLRFYAFKSKRRFFREYWLDILSVLPLFRAWRILRILRLLRLFRLGPLLARSNRRVAWILRATVGEQLTIFSMLLVTILAATFGIASVEHGNPAFSGLERSFWWTIFSVVAGEPVGETPESTAGRLFTLLVMMTGLTVFALFTGAVTAVMSERLRQGARHRRMSLDDLHDHVLVCGWNRSAQVLLAELRSAEETREVPIVVIAEARPESSVEIETDPLTFFLEGDYTRAEVLEAASVRRASRAILLADKSVPGRSDQDRDARTVLAGMTIEKLSPGIFTCAELLSRNNESHLLLAGIEEVVVGDEYSGKILAGSCRVGGLTEIADEIFSSRFGNQIFKREIPADWAGLTILDVQRKVKAEHDAIVIGVEEPVTPARGNAGRAYERMAANPPAGRVLREGESLLVVARKPPRW